MNQEQAQKCIDIGLKYLKEGNLQNALRLFHKSHRMHPSEESKAYIDITEQKITKISHSHESKPYIKSEPASTSNEASVPEAKEQYTKHQEELAKKILALDNYYDLLGVSKTATIDEIKKAYKKQALKLHPDKNKAPHATEAFKKINRAFTCLSDEQKRKRYDMTGTEESPGVSFNTAAYSDEWAEQIFREFFGGMFDAEFHHRHKSRRHHATHVHRTREETNRQRNNYWPLVQILPLLFLFVVSALVSLTSTHTAPQNFSLSPTTKFTAQLKTSNLKVPYWVERSVASKMTKSLADEFEVSVEEYYLNNLRNECNKQKTKKQNMIAKSQYYRGNQSKQYRDYANQVDLWACKKLEEIAAKG